MKKILIDVESSQASTSKETLIVVNVSLGRGDESCFRFHEFPKGEKDGELTFWLLLHLVFDSLTRGLACVSHGGKCGTKRERYRAENHVLAELMHLQR
jgi:hypothetical protein